jgi:hypothetical protein
MMQDRDRSMRCPTATVTHGFSGAMTTESLNMVEAKPLERWPTQDVPKSK